MIDGVLYLKERAIAHHDLFKGDNFMMKTQNEATSFPKRLLLIDGSKAERRTYKSPASVHSLQASHSFPSSITAISYQDSLFVKEIQEAMIGLLRPLLDQSFPELKQRTAARSIIKSRSPEMLQNLLPGLNIDESELLFSLFEDPTSYAAVKEVRILQTSHLLHITN